MMLWMGRNGISCVTADLYNDADLKLDIQATGLADESFDVIVCNHVLEHVDNCRIALRELHRLLHPGGSLICSFPIDTDVELLDEDPRCVRRKNVYGASAKTITYAYLACTRTVF